MPGGHCARSSPLPSSSTPTTATHALLQPQGEVAEGLHVLPLLISDSGHPPREQEQLLNVSVCICTPEGLCRARAAAVVGTMAGLSFGALMIILSSAVLLLCKCANTRAAPADLGLGPLHTKHAELVLSRPCLLSGCWTPGGGGGGMTQHPLGS